MSKDEQIFFDNLKRGLLSVPRQTKSSIDPENPFEYLGRNFPSLLAEVNEQENINPSTTQEAYAANWQQRLIERSDALSVSFVEDNMSLEARFLLAELIRQSLSFSDVQFSIDQLRFIENEIINSDIITNATRDFILGYSAMLRHMMAGIAYNGLVINGVSYGPDVLTGAWYDCFDQYFETAARNNFAVLTNWDSPFSTAAAWLGLHITLATAAADSIYQAVNQSISNC